MRIGLTGGIASGKSLVATYLEKQGIPVVDADKLARQVVEPGEPALAQIVATFGQNVLQTDGTLDRKQLGAIIFGDEQKRKQLNQIVHPAVRQLMKKQAELYEQRGYTRVVLDIPLLYESNLFHMVNQVWLVYVDEATQLRRLIERDGLTETEANQRIAAQMPLTAKKAQADVLIDNNGTKENTYRQVDNALAKTAHE
ncbi:dephospho-CoA kinase [Shouchella clausii]|jgi:dephospho-CoA kinase|uniref:Dephospho-CoA kinase n=1 Tax=Shouchella clausii TaxID=79880 RepID=A0A268S4A4_SHOCL|nr:dephospho-CoA kinase [Shouchella clausii]PAD42570.1 dephospho-CoA kinase [Bacillus sp. 7520-S]AST97021.1 dephospho-CoA kinase [Shouchella clausii]KKI86509.1 dephospho-CoA kinase [Shouchella clausii]MCR1286521.1 dephospho-CoA kinase [Shouchella clausii]MEB5473956.1 dephospho-CoA kinase [Shouchella clausii]